MVLIDLDRRGLAHPPSAAKTKTLQGRASNFGSIVKDGMNIKGRPELSPRPSVMQHQIDGL